VQTVQWYDGLLLSVPEAYAGPPARLRALVRLLGGEMAAAFSAAGAVTPPWRSPGSLLSKWLPAKARDRPVGDAPAGGALGGSPLDGVLLGSSLPSGHAAGQFRAYPTQSFAIGGVDLRTTSAPAATAGGSPGSGSGSTKGFDTARAAAPAPTAPATVAAAPAAPAPAPAAPQRQPDGRSDSEDDRLSSPDTTLAWRLPGRSGGRAAGQQPAAGAAADATGDKAVAAVPSGAQPGLPRAIFREELQGGSGGRTSPTAALSGAPAATATEGAAAAPRISSLRLALPATVQLPAGPASPPNPWLGHGQYAAHPQAPPRRKSAPAATDGAQQPSAGAAGGSLQPPRRGSTSALSSKLASAGMVSRQASGASEAAISSGGGSPTAAAPAPQGAPSVHAPFWDQPLIVDYIKAQQPGGGRTLNNGDGPKPGSLPGEPRIRTVKMRGAGGATQHAAGLRARLRA